MTKEINLEAELRGEKDGKIKSIRDAGFIPANIYGSGTENKNIKIKENDFLRIFREAGESHLINLKIGKDESVKVIVKDLQKDSVKDNVMHVDFYQVDMNKKIVTEIPLNFIGESKAVRELGGILIKSFDTVEVKCLPGNLVDKIDVDLSNLNNYHDNIHANEIILPEGIELNGDGSETIINVVEPVKEEKKEEVAAGEEKEGEATEGEEKKEEENGGDAKEGEKK